MQRDFNFVSRVTSAAPSSNIRKVCMYVCMYCYVYVFIFGSMYTTCANFLMHMCILRVNRIPKVDMYVCMYVCITFACMCICVNINPSV